jgi:choice-of-anchor C domain-containing protein
MRVLFASMTAAAMLAGSAQAATIVNGSFEIGVNPPTTSFTTLGAGNTDLTGWSIGGGGIDWIGAYWQASNGVRSLDMTAITAGSISQTLSTVIGQRYVVTFDLAGNPDPNGGPTLKSLDVTVNGLDLVNYTFDTTGFSTSNMGWESKSYSFVATSTSSTLAFTSNNGLASGPALDNVAVAVPEAATWAMMIAGFGLVGAASRRRRSAVAA